MKLSSKRLICLLLLSVATNTLNATRLLDVYKDAFQNDPVYQQSVYQRLAEKEGVAIAWSSLLPSAGANVLPVKSRSTYSGPATTNPGIVNTITGYTFNLNINQTLVDFGKIASLEGARAISKQADAILNTSTQDLILRTAKAYFQILEDQDNIRYLKATKLAYQKQYEQVDQQYKVGLKTVTDVYTANASYQASIAGLIQAQNKLLDDQEVLCAMTGTLYPSLAKLNENFPLIKPSPANIDDWVTTATRQNWSIKAAQHAVESAKQNVKLQFSGHLPTLNAGANYQIAYTQNSGDLYSILDSNGSAKINTLSGTLTLAVPILQGGYVNASTQKAKYQLQAASKQLEYAYRNTIKLTRQSYLGIISGISKLKADKETVKSYESSLKGMEEGYKVGTQILFNVLDQQQRVFQVQRQYASDRYEYINNLLSLKAAAGTLSIEDLMALDYWLYEPNHKKLTKH